MKSDGLIRKGVIETEPISVVLESLFIMLEKIAGMIMRFKETALPYMKQQEKYLVLEIVAETTYIILITLTKLYGNRKRDTMKLEETDCIITSLHFLLPHILDLLPLTRLKTAIR